MANAVKRYSMLSQVTETHIKIMITENEFTNNYSLDTNFLKFMAQFNFVYPEFGSAFEKAISDTYTRIFIPLQVEKEYKGLYKYTYPTQTVPEVLTIREDSPLIDSGTSEGRLNTKYFEPISLDSGDGIVYARDQKFTTLTADLAVANLAIDLSQKFPHAHSGVISDDSDVKKYLPSTVGSYTASDMIWATVHHSTLSVSKVEMSLEMLQKKGSGLFHTDLWSKIQVLPKQCILCHNEITYASKIVASKD